MAQVSLQVKPYKLKPTTESYITRDDFITWKYVLQSYIRQKVAWHQFMLAGDRSEWTSFGEDPTRGGTE